MNRIRRFVNPRFSRHFFRGPILRWGLFICLAELHGWRGRAVRPFGYSYQEYRQWREGLELWVGVSGHVPIVHGHDRRVSQVSAPGCAVFVSLKEHQCVDSFVSSAFSSFEFEAAQRQRYFEPAWCNEYSIHREVCECFRRP